MTQKEIEQKMSNEKTRRLNLWTKRLEEAEKAGDQIKIAEAKDRIWYIEQTY